MHRQASAPYHDEALTWRSWRNAHQEPARHVSVRESPLFLEPSNTTVPVLIDFDSYLADPAKTKAAFDADGWYKTGDEAHLVNGEYIIDGRIGADCK
jgi:acyl-CoA synthetase (AMP-forming)/AMP-acid ligase II